MAIMIVPFVVCLAGLLAFALADGKVSELGRLAFFAGLFWLVYGLAGKTVSIG